MRLNIPFINPKFAFVNSSLMIFLVILAAIVALLIYYSTLRQKPAITDNSVTHYTDLLESGVPFYQTLEQDKKQRFEKRIKDFLAYVHIEGVGTEITDLDRVLIASSAVIPVFGFEDWKYKNLTNVVLYPDTFDEKFQFEGESRNIMGMVGSGYMNGQMILSRVALYKGFSRSSGKENVGIHEFVHLLDKSDGTTDGVPETFMAHEYAIPWLKMMHLEMHKIQAGHSDINPYAASNEAEFLAVVSEYFFSKPEKFQNKHPELYEQLNRIFGLNPQSFF